MLRHPAVLAVAATVLIVALAGCAQPQASSSHPASMADPKSSPTRTVVAHPGWPFPIGCADILSLDEARTAAGSDLAVTGDESTPAAGVYDTAIRQGGALQCGWSTSSNQGNGLPIASLSVNVLPDASADEQSRVVDSMRLGGDASDPCDQGQCGYGGTVAGNAVEITWITAAHAHDADGGDAAFGAIVSRVTVRLADPGAHAPRWTAPSGPVPETFCDHGSGREQFIPTVAAALGRDAGTMSSAGGVGGDPGVIGGSVGRTDLGECAWASTDADRVFAGIWILAGGAWNLAGWRAAMPDARDAGDPAHPGAFVFDDGHGNFALALTSAGSLVEVDFSQTGLTAEQAPARMIAVARALSL